MRSRRECKLADGRSGIILWASHESNYWFGVPYENFDFGVVLANHAGRREAYWIPGNLLATGYPASDQMHFHLQFKGGVCWLDAAGELLSLALCPLTIN